MEPAAVLLYLLRIYEMVLMVRILMSWINPDPHHPVTRILWGLTEPVLAPVRRLLPLGGMGIDFSPIVVFLVLGGIERVLSQYFLY